MQMGFGSVDKWFGTCWNSNGNGRGTWVKILGLGGHLGLNISHYLAVLKTTNLILHSCTKNTCTVFCRDSWINGLLSLTMACKYLLRFIHFWNWLNLVLLRYIILLDYIKILIMINISILVSTIRVLSKFII